MGETQNSEVQAPSESEGKKWAKIIKEKGAGVLKGKFKRDWGYYDQNNSFHKILRDDAQETAFESGGKFGEEENFFGSTSVRLVTNDIYQKLGSLDRVPSQNYLIRGDPTPISAKDPRGRYKEWQVLSYITWYRATQTGDSRPTFIPLECQLTLPSGESSQFIEAVKRKPDLVEDVFQNIYPRFTGENGPKRSIVNKLAIIDNILIEETKASQEWPFPSQYVKSQKLQTLNFSKPVGEITS